VCGRIFPFRRILFLPLACSEKFHETFFEFFIVNFTEIYTKKNFGTYFCVSGEKRNIGGGKRNCLHFISKHFFEAKGTHHFYNNNRENTIRRIIIMNNEDRLR
jgi:hypothetical protein